MRSSAIVKPAAAGGKHQGTNARRGGAFATYFIASRGDRTSMRGERRASRLRLARLGGHTADVRAQADRSRLVPVLMWAAAVAGAVLLGLLVTPEEPIVPGAGRPRMRLAPPPTDIQALLYQSGIGSVTWYAIVLTLPIVVRVARRLDVTRLGRARMFATVSAGGIVLVAATSMADYLWSYGSTAAGPPVSAWIAQSLRQHVLPWTAVIVGVAAWEGRRRTLRANIDRERLRAEVAEQRLIALAGQLRPHFLFNALQAVSTLIHRDPAAADETLTKLSDLLRDVLRHRDSAYVRLEDEVRYARTWLEIAKVRFADRLQFEIDVPAELNDLQVPLFILQPLVENALTHGIGGRIEGGRVTVRGRRTGARLVLEVIDDGAGLPDAVRMRTGIGLANTRERLQASFGADQALALEHGPAQGAIARVEFPARPAAVRFTGATV
jgi:two-component system LytT family sensor kinase